MKKKTFTFLLFLFLSSCGYEAVYSVKNRINYSFIISELTLVRAQFFKKSFYRQTYWAYILFDCSQGHSDLLVGVKETPVSSWEDTPEIQLGVCRHTLRILQIKGCGEAQSNDMMQLPIFGSPDRLPCCKYSQWRLLCFRYL